MLLSKNSAKRGFLLETQFNLMNRLHALILTRFVCAELRVSLRIYIAIKQSTKEGDGDFSVISRDQVAENLVNDKINPN